MNVVLVEILGALLLPLLCFSFVKSTESYQFLVALDPINLSQYVLFCSSSFCTSWILLYHPNSYILKALLSGLEPMVSLILCLCMHLIPNGSPKMAIQNVIRNGLLLLLIVTWVPQNRIPEPSRLLGVCQDMLKIFIYRLLQYIWEFRTAIFPFC